MIDPFDEADAVPICVIDECGRIAHSKGWCRMHYERWRRRGDPEPSPLKPGIPSGTRGGQARERMFAVIAASTDGMLRVKDVKAANHTDAVARYNRTFDYHVCWVGLLGGSGHPLEWVGST